MNPHEKLAMEFFSPPGPSAREWRCPYFIVPPWIDGAEQWPIFDPDEVYEIRLKPQTITLPERVIPKPLDVGEMVDGRTYWMIDPTEEEWVYSSVYVEDWPLGGQRARRGLYYPYTDQGKADAIAAAKGMIGRDEG